MIRVRLLDEFESIELWQVECIRTRGDKLPAGFAWVRVEPGGNPTIKAEMLGVIVAEGLPQRNGIADEIIEQARMRWPGLRYRMKY